MRAGPVLASAPWKEVDKWKCLHRAAVRGFLQTLKAFRAWKKSKFLISLSTMSKGSRKGQNHSSFWAALSFRTPMAINKHQQRCTGKEKKDIIIFIWFFFNYCSFLSLKKILEQLVKGCNQNSPSTQTYARFLCRDVWLWMQNRRVHSGHWRSFSPKVLVRAIIPKTFSM